MAVGDLTPYDLKELLALTKPGDGPAAVVEKSQLLCLVDEVIRRRNDAQTMIKMRAQRKAKGKNKPAMAKLLAQRDLKL